MSVVVVAACVSIDRRDGAVSAVTGGVHGLTLSVGGAGDIGAVP
jgi:hypothetical protein